MAILQTTLVSGNLNITSSLAVTGSTTFLSNVSGTTAQFIRITGSLSGNSTTATTLQTARNINGTSFNGSTDITTSNWGTARNVTIGNTTRSVDGSTNYAWTIADIGAVSSSIALSPDNSLVRFDGLSGRVIQDASSMILSDAGDFSRNGDISMTTIGAGTNITLTAVDVLQLNAVSLKSNTGVAQLNTTGAVQINAGSTALIDAGTVLTLDATTNILLQNNGTTEFIIDSTALQGVELGGGAQRAPYIRSAETALNQLQAPLYSFVNDTNTGLTSTDADTVTLVTSGSGRLHIDTTAVFALLPHRGTNGSAAAPAYSFTAATGSGMWRSAKSLLFATDGESILSLNQNTVGNQVQAVPTGSAGRPAYTWLDDTQTGLFYDATDTYIGLTVAGTRRALFDTFGVTSGIVGGPTIKWSAGTAASPTYGFFADSNTGIYNPSADQISLSTGGSDRVRIDNNGKVGIGTTAPSKRLHINNSGLLIDGTNTIESSSLAARLIVDSGASTGHTLANFRNSGGSTLFVGGANVGIGTTTPGARLEVDFAGASSTTQYAAEFKSSSGTTNAGRVLFSQGSTFAMAIAPAGTSLSTGRIDFQYITRSTGVVSTTPLSVRGDGRIGIGTATPSFQLQLSTDSAAKPSTNTWTISSDIRIKENIRNYTKGLETLVQINPVTYDYNGKGGFNPDIKNNVGLIAQDIKDILPESISVYKTKLNPEDTEDTELYNFNSHALTYVMINCIKQLSSEVNTLKAKIDMLSAEVADLKK